MLVLLGLEGMSRITPALHLDALHTARTRGAEQFWLIYFHPLSTLRRGSGYIHSLASPHPCTPGPWCPLPALRHPSALLALGALSSQLVVNLGEFLPFQMFLCILTRCFSLELHIPDLTTSERDHLQVLLSLFQAGMDSALGLPHPGCRSWRAEGRCDAEAGKPDISKKVHPTVDGAPCVKDCKARADACPEITLI